MGPKGILEVAEHGLNYIPQTGQDTAPSYYAQGFPRAMREAYEKQWHAEHDPPLGHEPLAEVLRYSGPSYDDVKPHLWTFFEAVRNRKPVVQDAVFGHHAAAACHMANTSYFQQTRVTFDAATNTIKT
jgi:hypothetical protein